MNMLLVIIPEERLARLKYLERGEDIVANGYNYQITSGGGAPVSYRQKDYPYQVAPNVARPKALDVFNPEFTPGQILDYSKLYGAIGTGPRQFDTPQPTTQQQFTLEQLQQYINQARQAGGSFDRFQTPEHLAGLVQQASQILDPLTQQRQQEAQTLANRQQYDLQNRWASQGLLASGGAMAQGSELAQQAAREQDRIRAEQQAQALLLALQYGQLGLQESGMASEREQQAVANLLAALGQQEGMRQFEQTFGLDVERLRSEEMQNYLNQLARAMGMEESAGQWSQQFGLDRQASDFDRWFRTNDLNRQSLQDWMSYQLGATGLGEQARQFDMGQREGQRQFNMMMPLEAAKVFGYAGMPTNQGDVFWSQYSGAPTLQKQLGEMEAALQRTMTMGTVAPQDAAILGVPAGTPSWQAKEAAADRALRLQIAQMQASAARGGQSTSDLFRVWQMTGKAPAGLEQYGVAPGTSIMLDPAQQQAMKQWIEQGAIEQGAKKYMADYGLDATSAGQLAQIMQTAPTSDSAWSMYNYLKKQDQLQGDARAIRKALEKEYPKPYPKPKNTSAMDWRILPDMEALRP